jgi:hypothetical protein
MITFEVWRWNNANGGGRCTFPTLKAAGFNYLEAINIINEEIEKSMSGDTRNPEDKPRRLPPGVSSAFVTEVPYFFLNKSTLTN